MGFHCCPGESAQPRVLPGETTAGVSRAASAAGMPRDALHAPSDKRAPVARACRWLGADLALRVMSGTRQCALSLSLATPSPIYLVVYQYIVVRCAVVECAQ